MAFTQELSWWAFGHIRATTVAAGLLLLAAWWWRTGRPPWAVTGVVAWGCLYEILWDWTGLVAAHFHFSDVFWLSVAFSGWVWFAWNQGFRLHAGWGAACAAAWILWIATGFHYNTLTVGQPFDPVAEFLNVATKSLLAAAFYAGTRMPPSAP
ncbi:MAG: hypothetical protein ACYDBQ_03855 [Thermoplasmatota archaeon]